jgi:hypothetical protein
MICLKHNDVIMFDFLSRFNGVIPAAYRVYSAISGALEAGADPGPVQDSVALDRITATGAGIPVQNGEHLMIEGKYFTLVLNGDQATIKRVGS